MRIKQIKNKINYNPSYNLNFGRKPKKEEEADLQQTLKEGFEAAGVKERFVITHGSVFPAAQRDTHIGSPYGKGAEEYTKFLMLLGFNGVQLGPTGKLQQKSISPYEAFALNENPLFIDLKPLTEEEYGNILSKDTYEAVTSPLETTDENYTFTDFDEAKRTYYIALNEAYKNFKIKLSKNQPQAIKLNKEFNEYLEKNNHKQRTEEEAVFKILSALHGTEDFRTWDNDTDEWLITGLRDNDAKAKIRYKDIKDTYKNAIEEYQFEQFLTTKQIKENKDFRDKYGFKYSSDILVGCSHCDEWRYRKAFLDDYRMGAFEGDPGKPHQIWDIPVINPRMLFAGDELNLGGQFLREKFQHALEFCETTRIDHALGLIDPYIYKPSTIIYDSNNKLIKDKLEGAHLGYINSNDGKKLDDYGSYRNILSKILIPVIQENGLDIHDPMWEDMGHDTAIFNEVYNKQYNLPKIITNYRFGEFAGTGHWYIVGSHDDVPALHMLDQDGGWRRNDKAWNPLFLAGYLHQDNETRSQESKEFCEKISDKKAAIDENTGEFLKNDKGEIIYIDKKGLERQEADKERVKAKFAELFTKNKIQVSFADLLGITEDDVVYNIGGSKRDMNWYERITPDFVDKYFENLSSDNPTALNVPEILITAVKANIDKKLISYANSLDKNDKDKTNKVNQKRTELHEQYKPLLEKLEHYKEIFKEKE